MYVPRHFAEEDRQLLLDLAARHSFGALIVPAGGDVEIAHLPFVIYADAGQLRGHVARANPVWKLFDGERIATAVFTGPHAYVTPTWYTSRGQVPTWNYAVVHVRGPVRCMPARGSDDDGGRDELVAGLRALVAAHERGPDAWSIDDLDPAVLDRLARAIVGFTLSITEIRGKLKLSQNRAEKDRAGVTLGLTARDGPGDRALAELMHERAQAREHHER